MKFGPGAVEDPFVEVTQLITDSTGRSRRLLSEADHMRHRDDELANANEKKADLENQFSVCNGEVVELQADLGTLFAQKHVFLNISQKKVRSCVFLTSKLLQFRPIRFLLISHHQSSEPCERRLWNSVLRRAPRGAA